MATIPKAFQHKHAKSIYTGWCLEISLQAHPDSEFLLRLWPLVRTFFDTDSFQIPPLWDMLPRRLHLAVRSASFGATAFAAGSICSQPMMNAGVGLASIIMSSWGTR